MEWRQASGAAALELIEKAAQQIEDDDNDSQARAEVEAAADVSLALGVRYDEMTPAQREFIATHLGRNNVSQSRPGFFSIPHEHRKPEKR